MKFAVIAVIAGNHLVHDWWFVLHSLLLVTNGGKLCAAHCRHICCITALLPGQLSHCNLQMSTSNPLQLHLLRRVSRWNINLLTVRSWNEVLSILTFHIFLKLPCFILLHTSLHSCLTTKPFCLCRLDRLQGKCTNRLKGGSLKHHHPCHLADFFPWPKYKPNC